MEHKANILNRIEELQPLVKKLKGASSLSEKEALLLTVPKVLKKFYQKKWPIISSLDLRIVLLSLLLIDQEDGIVDLELLRPLCKVEAFYEKMGGLVGYHLKVLEMIAKHEDYKTFTHYEQPEGIDLKKKKTCIDKIEALADIGEIYLVGGLGDRLRLMNEKGDAMPAALLPFLGKSLLEILVRDLEAREYLYYKLYQKRLTTPLALMTSLEKENERHIRHLLEKNNWFGRDPENFYLFQQILVPVVNIEGQWIFKPNGECLLHPGGHGAIWKACEEEGVYDWFQSLSKKAFLIRQINNPIAGLDGGLIKFIVVGSILQKTLGIASCERVANAAEGVLVNVKKENGKWATINIEYTDFQKYGIEDFPNYQGYSQFPTNTNIMYVDLAKIVDVVKKHPLPDVLLNMKTKIENILVGRLESMMQNITHHLTVDETFVTYNMRPKTISTAKKAFEEGKSLLETPEGAFYELLSENMRLAKILGFTIPDFPSQEEYLTRGPAFYFLYHPALGPFYDIIAKKIHGGNIAFRSELQLDLSELYIENIYLKGSLLIEARKACGDQPGFCFLKNVHVFNEGIDYESKNCYWKNQMQRKGACQIILEENAELIAEDVMFKGDMIIHVPAHMRWKAYEKDGKLNFEKEKVKKRLSWSYQRDQDEIRLSLDSE